MEAGVADATIETLSAAALALGGELSVRFYPGTGPRIRDRLQAAMIEAFLNEVHPRWERHLEVPVYRPAAGVIDLVLADWASGEIIAAEFQSQIRRLEQQLRWATAKSDSLASTSVAGLADAAGSSRIQQLLVLRSTYDTRVLATQMAATLAVAYPAKVVDVLNALRGTARWPGAGIVWISLDGGRATVMDGPPRGVKLGR
jgi:hypothetical protein